MFVPQEAFMKLILANLPEHIKDSPAILDVIDKSHDHIKGGDPLSDNLFIKALMAIVTKQAAAYTDVWKKSIANDYIDTFGNSPFITSPELMLSLFDNGVWAPSLNPRHAQISITMSDLRLEIFDKTYLYVMFENNSYSTPEWLPYLLRHLCCDDIPKIEITIEGSQKQTDLLCELLIDLFKKLHSVDLTKRNGITFAPKTVSHGYDAISGTVNFTGHAKRRDGCTVFYKMYNVRRKDVRDDLDVIKNDFTMPRF